MTIIRKGKPMRLIDADRLLEDKRIEKYYHLKNGDTAIPIIDIRHAPTIERREKGHWKLDFAHNKMTCSECGHTFDGGFDLDGADNFCRHCGADMRGEQDE